MAAYVKYDTYVENLSNKLIDALGTTDTWRAVIHTDAPINTSPTPDNALSDLIQIANSNGYVTGGEDISFTSSRGASTGIVTATATDKTWTASGGELGGTSAGGRYFSIYDDTSTGNNLLCSFDYGGVFAVLTGETMTLDFGTTLYTLS